MTGQSPRPGRHLALVPEARGPEAGAPKAGAPERIAFLERLSDPDWERFLDAACHRTYRPGETVISQDSFADLLLLVLHGHLQESHLTRDGQKVILDIHGPGDVVGATSVVDGRPALATVQASVRSDTLLVRGSALRPLLIAAPSLCVGVLQCLARQARQAERARISSATLQVLPRISRRLVEMAERWGDHVADGVAINLGLSQGELAAWAGVSREATVRALKTLREQGLVDTGRRRMTVTDFDGLRACAWS